MGRWRGAEHFRRTGLIEAALQADQPDGLQQPGRGHAGHIPRVFGLVETHSDMALSCEMVHLIRLDLRQQRHQAGTVGQVTIVKVESGLRVVWIGVEVLDPVRVERARPADQAVNNIPLLQQQLSKV